MLPGNQLASVSGSGTIRVWDTRDEAGGAGGSLVRREPAIACESDPSSLLAVLAPLPDNRLAAGGNDGVYLWQLPCRHVP